MARSSLSAALLLIAYILQQRLRPFLVSSTLSERLALSSGDLEARLKQTKGPEGGQVVRGRKGSVALPSGTSEARVAVRKKSRAPSMGLSPGGPGQVGRGLVPRVLRIALQQ